MNPIFTHRAPWPDGFDLSVMVIVVVGTLLLPLVGYWFMVVDIRAYLRALRGVLVRISYYVPGIPEWAQRETPSFLRVLGLKMPCTEKDVKRAYRQLAKEMHPDRGGDRRRFQFLQEQTELALEFVRKHEPTY